LPKQNVLETMNKWKEDTTGTLVVLAAYVVHLEEMFTITAQ